MTEKILAKHSDNTKVVPGQNIWTNVDKLMTHDVCGPGTFGIFQREFGENAQVGMLLLNFLRISDLFLLSQAWPPSAQSSQCICDDVAGVGS